jgi:hypothetical protein
MRQTTQECRVMRLTPGIFYASTSPPWKYRILQVDQIKLYMIYVSSPGVSDDENLSSDLVNFTPALTLSSQPK